ncbi:hypothetical protein EDD22DRAFT_950662 [Suillus occidentalis]|nr:hypothetical protein EDD22DRAFT_950662 [Suillus occidentalis]
MPPWVLRIEEIRAGTAINAEAEHKAAQLQEEIQGLVRNLKMKGQAIPELGVKIERMERRMEAAKKQAGTGLRGGNGAIAGRFGYVRARQCEAEGVGCRFGATSCWYASENVPVEGNVEASHLPEQIEALRGTVRFLCTENLYHKGHPPITVSGGRSGATIVPLLSQNAHGKAIMGDSYKSLFHRIQFGGD